MSDQEKTTLSKIRSGVLSRGLALARVSMGAGAKAASHAVGNLFADESKRSARLTAMLIKQAEALSKELGVLKGSLMKVGQMVSMYGENLLPPEANAFLKSLQSQSPALEWAAIEKQLRKQLGPEKLALLEVERDPVASASLGQVHRARVRADGRVLALKIQYPGVDKAIDSDIRALRSLLTISKLIPAGPRLEELFKEVRQMLHKEVDYVREAESTERFRALLAGDDRYVVPEVAREFSTARVLATSFEEGVPVDSPEVLGLPQERRNALGAAFLDLYFRELLEWNAMQTDPHFGNYRVRVAREPGGKDRLVLLDFGAVREFPQSFMDPYIEMLKGSLYGDLAAVERGAVGLGFFQESDSEEAKRAFAEFCFLFGEPFRSKDYDWASSDLARRVMKGGPELAFKFRLRPPPREVVFLDRKMGGVFIFLQKLAVRVPAMEILERRLSATSNAR